MSEKTGIFIAKANLCQFLDVLVGDFFDPHETEVYEVDFFFVGLQGEFYH